MPKTSLHAMGEWQPMAGPARRGGKRASRRAPGDGARRVDVNVGTLRNVERILSEASVPVSRYYVLRELAKAGHGTTSPRLEVALEYLMDHDWVIDGSKGVQWVHSGSPSLQGAIATGRRVA